MLNVTNKADACDATIDGVNYCTRGFKIRMVCSPAVEYLPLENSIEEDAGCSYTVRVNSKYACPAQCPWGKNGKVCSGKGLCYFSGYSEDDDDNEGDAKGSATAYCLCKSGTNGQQHKGADCGTYSRWGESYGETYDYLSSKTGFWVQFWGVLFLLVTALTCLIQRHRIVPMYTGLKSLWEGDASGIRSFRDYQRVSALDHKGPMEGSSYSEFEKMDSDESFETLNENKNSFSL